jgi:hypothetical protein
MFSVFVCFGLGQIIKRTYHFSQLKTETLRFGFDAGGSFSFEANLSRLGQHRGFLLTESEVERLNKQQLVISCGQEHIAKINHSQIAWQDHFTWSGTVPERGIYSLHFGDCNSNHMTVELTAVMTNRGTRLDIRHVTLPKLYSGFALVHAILTIIWVANAILFSNFRIPLHTLFVCVPAVRCLSLTMMAYYWHRAAKTDEPWKPQEYYVFVLDVVFHALNIAGIAIAAAGICIYRETLETGQLGNILGTSFAAVGSVISVQFLSGVEQVFIVLGIFVASFVSYLKESITSILILSELMREMVNDSQILSKLLLSRKFSVKSALTISVTLAIWLLCTFGDVQPWIRTIAFEGGLLANTAIQAQFFLLRQSYCGHTLSRRPPLRKRLVNMMTPLESKLVVLQTASQNPF